MSDVRPVELVDTHCHIQSIGVAAGERTTRALWDKAGLSSEQVIAQATAHGVTRLVCVGCDVADSQLAVAFAGPREGCWASIGIHPHEAQHYFGDEASQAAALKDFTLLTKQPKVVAIGECGLDYHYNHSPKAAQLKALEFQLSLAQEAQLPVIFHVREALSDFWPILDQYPGVHGVLHSFTDSVANLEKALERGLSIGVNGIATFAKDPEHLAMYQAVPLEKLLLETDAPFLTPHPYRGKINTPERVGIVADFVAQLRGEDRQHIAEVTTTNARTLFGI